MTKVKTKRKPIGKKRTTKIKAKKRVGVLCTQRNNEIKETILDVIPNSQTFETNAPLVSCAVEKQPLRVPIPPLRPPVRKAVVANNFSPIKAFSLSGAMISVLVGLIFGGIFCAGVYVFATAWPYTAPGPNDPGCSPTDSTCNVKPPLTDGFTADFSGTGNLTTTSTGTFGIVSVIAGDLNLNNNFITNGTQPGSSNFIGNNAGAGATSASSANFLGPNAGNSATNAQYSNFLGSSSGSGAANAPFSNFIGYNAGINSTNADHSNFMGGNTGLSATNADHSNFFGYMAGTSAVNASFSNFFGYYAGTNSTNAANSIFIGAHAGFSDAVDNVTANPGGTSIAIGQYSGTGGFSDSVAIGHGVMNSAATQMNLGNVININGIYNSDAQSSGFVTGATVDLGSNALTTTGAGTFGTFQLTGGLPQMGYVLTSDGSGNGTWQAPPSSMVYPSSAGIAVMGASTWGTSISGTSSQFVKADGSLDSTAYYPASNPQGYWNISNAPNAAADSLTFGIASFWPDNFHVFPVNSGVIELGSGSGNISLNGGAVLRGQSFLGGVTATAANFGSTLNAGLQAHFKMNDNLATTNVVENISGNNGTLTGGPNTSDISVAGVSSNTTPVPGHGALNFNGSDYITTPYQQTAVAAYSISVWIKTSATGGIWGFPIVNDRDATGNSLTLLMGRGGGNIFGGDGELSFIVDSTNVAIGVSTNQAFNDGNWHHVVGTWSALSGTTVDPSQFQIYVDGVNQQTASFSWVTPPAPTSPLSGSGNTQIGYHSAWGSYFNGSMDDLRIYSRVLSANEIVSLWNNGNGTEIDSLSAPANYQVVATSPTYTSADPLNSLADLAIQGKLEVDGQSYFNSTLTATGAGVFGNIVSGATPGSQPYATTSTTLNANLNADLLDGMQGNSSLPWTQSANFNIVAPAGTYAASQCLAVYNGVLYASADSNYSATGAKVSYLSSASSTWVVSAPNFVVNVGAKATTIESMAVYNGKLYAAMGSIDDSNTNTDSVWAYDGSSWTLSNYFGAGYTDVRSLAVYNGKLYAGTGNAAGTGALYSFDGTTWTLVSNFGGAYGRVHYMATYNGKLYLGMGSHAPAEADVYVYDGSAAPSLAHSFGAGYDTVRSMAVYNSKLYFGLGTGTAALYSFDGSAWVQVADAAHLSSASRVESLLSYSGKLYIGLGANAGNGVTYTYGGSNVINSVALDNSFGVDQVEHFGYYNGKLYASLGRSDGDAIVYSKADPVFSQLAQDLNPAAIPFDEQPQNFTKDFSVKTSGERTAAAYGGYVSDAATNTTTDGINKYGLYIDSSAGTFTGGGGAATNNYGIYLATTAGGDNNYDIYAASGAKLTTGGVWTNASSKEFKENYTVLDSQDILNKINQLPVEEWDYKTEGSSVKHIGPFAEDFYSIFGVGNDDKSISTIDPAGVALIGIQELSKEIGEIKTEIGITGTVGDGTVEGVGLNSSFTQEIQNILAALGLKFDNGAVKLNKVEMVDQTTGDVYCTWISNGEWQKAKGDCGSASSVNPPATSGGSPTPDATPSTTPDTTAPVITLLGDSVVNLNIGDSYTDAGATALDDVDGDVTSKIVVVNSVDTANAGTYIITYNVSDAAGNRATEVTRTVAVLAAENQTSAPTESPSIIDTTSPSIDSGTTGS